MKFSFESLVMLILPMGLDKKRGIPSHRTDDVKSSRVGLLENGPDRGKERYQ